MPTLKRTTAPGALETLELPPDQDGKIAKLFVRPWGSAQRLAAIRAYGSAIKETGDQSVGDVAYAIGAVCSAVAGWEGFTVEVAPGVAEDFPFVAGDLEVIGALETFLAEEFGAYSAVHAQYVAPALEREAEKNGLSPRRAGGSRAGAVIPTKKRSSRAGAGGTTAGRAKQPAKPAR